MHFYFVTIKRGLDCFCYDGKLNKKLWVGIKHFLFCFVFLFYPFSFFLFPFFSFILFLHLFFPSKHLNTFMVLSDIFPSGLKVNSPEIGKVHSWHPFLARLTLLKKKNRANVPPWCHTGLHAPLRTVTAAWRSFCPPRPRLDCLVFVPFPNMQFELLLLSHKASILPESKTEGFSKGGWTQRAQTFIRV